MTKRETAAPVFLALTIGFGVVSPARAEEGSDWYPSKYGPEDTLGALNELSREGVLAATRLVTTGKTYALGGVTGRSFFWRQPTDCAAQSW